MRVWAQVKCIVKKFAEKKSIDDRRRLAALDIFSCLKIIYVDFAYIDSPVGNGRESLKVKSQSQVQACIERPKMNVGLHIFTFLNSSGSRSPILNFFLSIYLNLYEIPVSIDDRLGKIRKEKQ